MMSAIFANLPALQVILPLLFAPICFLLRKRGAAWLLAFCVSLCTFAVSIALFMQVSAAGPLSYAMGGWDPPWGIEYRVDSFNAPFLVLLSLMFCVTLAFSYKSVEKEIVQPRHALFYSAFMLCVAGLLGIVITGDAFNVFVFLEISSLSSYILISFGKDRRALTAAFQYLIMGTIGATFLLIGIGFIYMMTGTLNMADLAVRLPPVMDTHTVRAAFAFIIVGMSIKAALFPLHVWLPNAYGYAPSAASVFLAATSTKVSLYVLIRFTFTVFGAGFAFGAMPLQPILLVLAVTAVFVGSLSAIFQTNIKHVLVYSSVAQIGYMVIGFALASHAGLSAGILHMFNHAVMKGCLFLVAGCVFYRFRSARIEDFRGLGKTMPWTMGAFVVGGLGLIGMPLTAGFVSKWYLIMAALDHGFVGFLIIAAVLAGSLLAVAYVWRIVEVAYFQAPDEVHENGKEAPFILLVPAWFMALLTLYIGIDPSLVVGAAESAALSLLGSTP